MPVTRQGTNDAMTQESIQTMIDRAIQRNYNHTQDDASQSLGGGLRRLVQPARHRTAMIHRRDDIPKEDMPPRRRFVFTAPSPGCDVAESSATAARAPREDVGYVRALQASERRMMTSIEEVNLKISYQAQVHRQESNYFYTQLHDAQTDHIDIRLKIDVVRGQRTAYETEL
uniref:Uncharacterized protein n=1 Tax=Tanacetum cinerariifolium TaxID=118510 RepID=A0A6L2M5T1_TANCI|nr:hypothetical protein [Tanacetum cinerariifolium]